MGADERSIYLRFFLCRPQPLMKELQKSVLRLRVIAVLDRSTENKAAETLLCLLVLKIQDTE